MDALLERLDTKLREWKPETIEDVRHRLFDIIEWADHDALDLGRYENWSRRFWTFWMNLQSGEVWLADLGLAAKTRPVATAFRALIESVTS